MEHQDVIFPIEKIFVFYCCMKNKKTLKNQNRTYWVWSVQLFGNNMKEEILAHFQDKESHCSQICKIWSHLEGKGILCKQHKARNRKIIQVVCSGVLPLMAFSRLIKIKTSQLLLIPRERILRWWHYFVTTRGLLGQNYYQQMEKNWKAWG